MPDKYSIFISYSRLDSRAATYLQRSLEAFAISRPLRAGDDWLQNRPSLKPVFRDRRDLSTSDHSFSVDIAQALTQSRFLLVLCSPNAATSPWVEQEIRHFLNTHDRDFTRVIPVALDGSLTAGHVRHCLPPSLRTPVITSRNLPWMIPEPGEKQAHAWQNGLVQILSYILKADRNRVDAELRHQKHRKQAWTAGIAAVALILCAAAGLAIARHVRTSPQLPAPAPVKRLSIDAYLALGASYQAQGHLDKAQEALQNAIDTSIEKHGENHEQTAVCRLAMAELLTAQCQFEKALEEARCALAICNHLTPGDSELEAKVRLALGKACSVLADTANAETQFSRVMELHKTLALKNDMDAECLYESAILCLQKDNAGQARTHLDNAHNLLESRGQISSALCARILCLSAILQSETPYATAADALLAKAGAIARGKQDAVLNADVLTATGIVRLNQKQDSQAFESLFKALSICQSTPSCSQMQHVKVHEALARYYDGKKQHTDALEHYLKVQQINRLSLSSLHPLVALNYRQLGETYWKLHMTTLASIAFNQALDIYAKLPETPKAILDQCRKAADALRAGAPASSQKTAPKPPKPTIDELKKAVEMAKKTAGDFSDAALDAHTALANALYAGHHNAAAATAYLDALEIQIRLHGENTIKTAEFLQKAASAKTRQGKKKDAVPLLERALKIHQALTPEGSQRMLSLCRSLEYLCMEVDDFQRTADICKTVIDIREKHPEFMSDMNYSPVLRDYGLVSMYLKKPEITIIYIPMAIELKKRYLPSENAAFINLYGILALAYKDFGKLPEALEAVNKALAIAQKTGQDRRNGVAYLYSYRAQIYSAMKDYEKAIESDQIALDAYKNAKPCEWANIVVILNQLGLFHEAANDYDNMLKYHREAVDSLQFLPNYTCRATCFILRDMGLAYARVGQMEKARQSFAQALETIAKVPGIPQRWTDVCKLGAAAKAPEDVLEK